MTNNVIYSAILRIVFFLSCLSISINAFCFTYNQKMIEYRGGVISELNNCGPTYTDNGKYLNGQRNLSAKLTTKNMDVENFYNIGGGIVTLFKDGSVYFSPDGRYLDGGGSAVKLTTLLKNYLIPNDNPRPTSPQYGEYLNLLAGYDDSLIMIQTQLNSKYSTGKVIGKNCTRPGVCTDIYELGYKHDITVMRLPSRNIEQFSYVSTKLLKNILGSVNGNLYIQYSDGDIASFGSVAALRNFSLAKILHVNAPQISKVIPYRHGLAAYTPTAVYWSNNPNQVISGSDVKRIYSGTRNISSVLNYHGNSATESSIRVNASQGLLVAFEDGNIYFSPDGNNLSGGGSTLQLVKPFDIGQIKLRVKAYLDGLANAAYLSPQNPYEFWSPQTGSGVDVNKLTVRLLNKGDAAEYAKNTVFADGKVYSKITSLVSDFGGEPARINLYDKGWDGIQYKWRDRGFRTGLVEHRVDASYIGVPEIRIQSTNSCVVSVTYAEIGGNVQGFTVIDWNLNANFTVANNSAGTSAVSAAFAPGGVSYNNLLPVNYRLRPEGYTLMELYEWSIYNAGVYVKDRYGINLVTGELPLYYMRTDADRLRFPN